MDKANEALGRAKEDAREAAQYTQQAINEDVDTKAAKIKEGATSLGNRVADDLNAQAAIVRDKAKEKIDQAKAKIDEAKASPRYQKYQEEKEKVKGQLKNVTGQTLDFSARAAEFIAEKAREASEKLKNK